MLDSKAYHREYYIKNRERILEESIARDRHLRMEVILAYGPWCHCEECPYPNPGFEFLTLDHVDNNGADHRREIGEGQSIVRWAKKNNYPDVLQVLCCNCNFAKQHSGGGLACPHVLNKIERKGLDSWPQS